MALSSCHRRTTSLCKRRSLCLGNRWRRLRSSPSKEFEGKAVNGCEWRWLTSLSRFDEELYKVTGDQADKYLIAVC